MRLKGYTNYEIDLVRGTVYNYRTKRFIGTKNEKGYTKCTLHKDEGGYQSWMLHRLIWTAANGPIPEGLEVNHIDENKENNSIYNLNLMTHKENVNWGYNCKKKSKPVVAILNNKIIMYFDSTKDAERKKKFAHTNINKCCKQNIGYKTAYGYQWKYIDDYLGDLLERIQDEDMKEE